jgi:aspartyl protease family protein
MSPPRRTAPHGRSKTTGYAVIWLSLGALAFLAFNAAVSPKIARPVVTDGSGVVTIERSRDQHFYVEGTINGHRVTFLVDTGASLVSVSNELASKTGLSPGAPFVFDTAGGRVVGRVVPEASVRVGGIRVDGIRIGVGTGEQALLGQNFLNKVELTQGSDRMVLRARTAQ